MSALYAEVLEPPTPEKVLACALDPFGELTEVARFTAGTVVGIVKRHDYRAPDGSIAPSLFTAGINWDDDYNAGVDTIEISTDTPGSIESLPDLVAVLGAVHQFMTLGDPPT